MCFVWITEQTAIISLYNTNWLVLITEMKSVYCAVRIKSLSTIQVNFRCYKAMTSITISVLYFMVGRLKVSHNYDQQWAEANTSHSFSVPPDYLRPATGQFYREV